MTENPVRATGSSDNPHIEWATEIRLPAADPADSAVAGLVKASREHSATFSAAADLSANLPADVREDLVKASTNISNAMSTAYDGRRRADDFLNDIKLYPEGRKMLAGEALKAATDKVDESLEQTDALIEVATAQTYEAARPRVAPDAALTARADLQMITQRHIGNSGALIDAVRSLAKRSDSVGALVADQGYLGDWLSASGVDDETRESVLTLVRNEVVQAAALSGDPKRAAAGKTHLALAELRKARIAAQSFTRHMLSR